MNQQNDTAENKNRSIDQRDEQKERAHHSFRLIFEHPPQTGFGQPDFCPNDARDLIDGFG
jgi:hypothetical protein